VSSLESEALDELFIDVVTHAGISSESDAIVVEDLSKVYPNGTEAVRGISFRVGRGEVYGILGPNGAGKSTTIGMLGTLVKSTGGRALVSGIDVAQDPRSVHGQIGFAMQEVGVDDLATGREFLVLQGRLNGLAAAEAERRAELLLRLVDLEDAADKRMGGYSGGMKRRADLASALIHMPSILFLDEPTEGLDPRGRVAIWDALHRLKRELSITVVLTTHYMDEADRLCDRIGIIDRGQIVAEGTPEQLKSSVSSQALILNYGPQASPDSLSATAAVLSGLDDINDVVAADGHFSVYVDDAARLAPELLRILEGERLTPLALAIKQPTLEDVYLRYTGKSFEASEDVTDVQEGSDRT
jgi:ABC-2 type transport system ATP-binding protein